MSREDERVTVAGWLPTTPRAFLRCARRGIGPDGLPGDAVVVGERADEVTIATTLTAARPYYWTRAATPSGIVHGDDVFDVALRAGLRWRWDDQAIATLAVVRHLIGEQALHPAIHRVPGGAVLHARRGAVELRRADPLTPALNADDATPIEVVRALRAVVSELPGDPLLAMTAGLDSRLLLAALLREGHRPTLWTAGPPDCPDVLVARAIARATGLPHHVVELDAAGYLEHARAISRATGGAYLAGDWHSRLLYEGAQTVGAPVVVKGTNGELARSFYAGFPGAALAARLPRGAARARLELTVRRGRQAFPTRPAFLDPADGLAARLAALCAGPAGRSTGSTTSTPSSASGISAGWACASATTCSRSRRRSSTRDGRSRSRGCLATGSLRAGCTAWRSDGSRLSCCATRSAAPPPPRAGGATRASCTARSTRCSATRRRSSASAGHRTSATSPTTTPASMPSRPVTAPCSSCSSPSTRRARRQLSPPRSSPRR